MQRFSTIFGAFLLLAIAGQGLSAKRESEKPAKPSLADLWDGKAEWVCDAETVGNDFGFHCLSILRERDEFWAYYIHNYTRADGKTRSAIGRARGTDGLRWTDDGKVLDVGQGSRAWDDRLASFPGVWKDGDTWYLVYEGAADDIPFSPGEIGLATSVDGKNFVKHPDNPILRREMTGWERGNIGTPSLYKENDTWFLFYHGYDGTVCQVGVASGKNLTKLTKSAANPILPVASGNTAWDTGGTGKRSAIVKEGRYYYFAFEGSTQAPFDKARWSSGLARTTDLTSAWEKHSGNPMITQTAGGFGFDAPEMLRIGETWYLYVRLGNASQRFRLIPRP